jgi:hypothetical protein
LNNIFDRLPNLEIFFWILASTAAVIAFLVFAPTLLQMQAGSPTAVRATATLRPTLTPIPSATAVAAAPSAAARTPRPIPTPPANGAAFSFSADPKQSGWITDMENLPHWGDRSLHAGTYKGQVFQTLLYFDLSELAPGSKVLFAAIDLTGLNRSNIGINGTWQLKMLPLNIRSNWVSRPSSDFREAKTVADIGAALHAEDLSEEQINQFIFAPDQLVRLEEAIIGSGQIAFRLDGPSGSGDNLFTWAGMDANVGMRSTLRLIVVPESFAYITQTPTPQNVLTAAAIVAQSTEFAKLSGSPTSLPRKYATVLPLVPITPQPTSANQETATAMAYYATAVAATTGTFTPMPTNWYYATAQPTLSPTPTLTPTSTPTGTPLPLVIPIQSLTPEPTATPAVLSPNMAERAKQPFPTGLTNKILFLSGSRSSPQIWVMDPDGKNLGLVSDQTVYDRAAAREVVNPAGTFLLYNGSDQNFSPDNLQIWVQFLGRPPMPPQRLTSIRSGIAFGPSWSPTSYKIAYTSSELGKDEIFVMDMDSKKSQKITNTTDWNWNQYPSWSPDGRQIAYCSDRFHAGMFTEIWVMNATGGGEHSLGDGKRDAWAPIWVKW